MRPRGGPTATSESELADVPLGQPRWACPADVRLSLVLGAGPPRLECSIGASWGPARAQPRLQPPSELAREYVCSKYAASDYVRMDTAIQNRLDGHFSYVDLNLISPLEARGHA
ncbi:hypothetical protein PAL_GLEAN10012090 [Pteropus alecto]|uniref:Uncharacterized protein n=1 Tax=Pteropus alecto TaxID=9402 RepID=L5K6G4_PTEAL|nr:hypothetical protein PAL_GLEAN10012090 [Pteropus alecto]